MTLENLKNNILLLLDVTEASSESALCAAIDSVSKKVALYAKNIKKSTALSFTQSGGKVQAALPADFAAFGYICAGRCICAREAVEVVSGKIRTARLGAGTHELVYFAYPPDVGTETSGETDLALTITPRTPWHTVRRQSCARSTMRRVTEGFLRSLTAALQSFSRRRATRAA